MIVGRRGTEARIAKPYDQRTTTNDQRRRSRHAAAWLVLLGAFSLHVLDEALTGFLDFYNPLVLRVRERWASFPMPTFTFEGWMTMLVIVLTVLALFTFAVKRGAPGASVASWLFAGIMAVNGAAHLVGSAYFGRWLPGATSAPLLVAAAWYLIAQSSRRDTETPG